MANYFSGNKGRAVIVGIAADALKIFRWTYVSDKSLVDITNSLSFGKDQFIANLHSGEINAEGYMTDNALDNVFLNDSIVQGQEIQFDLYFDYADTSGFTNIDCIIDEFDFSMENSGNGKFKIKALISEPKI